MSSIITAIKNAYKALVEKANHETETEEPTLLPEPEITGEAPEGSVEGLTEEMPE